MYLYLHRKRSRPSIRASNSPHFRVCRLKSAQRQCWHARCAWLPMCGSATAPCGRHWYQRALDRQSRGGRKGTHHCTPPAISGGRVDFHPSHGPLSVQVHRRALCRCCGGSGSTAMPPARGQPQESQYHTDICGSSSSNEDEQEQATQRACPPARGALAALLGDAGVRQVQRMRSRRTAR